MGTGLIHDDAAEQFGRWTILRETGPAAQLFDLDRFLEWVRTRRIYVAEGDMLKAVS